VNKIVAALLKNKWIKLLSLVLATATWVYVKQKSYDNRENQRVVLVLQIPENKFLLTQKLPVLYVTVGGPLHAVEELRENSLTAEIDLLQKLGKLPDASVAPQPVTVPISPSDVQGLPPGVEITELKPSRVTIRLDEMVERPLTVKVDRGTDLIGKVREDCEVYAVKAVPDHVLLRGPKSILDRRRKRGESIHPLPINISGLGPNEWHPVRALDPSDKESGLANCLTQLEEVKVWITVGPKKTNRVVKNVKVTISGLPPGFTYTMLAADTYKPLLTVDEVEIKGPRKSLDAVQLRAIVDVADVDDPKEHPEVTRRIRYSVVPKDPKTTPQAAKYVTTPGTGQEVIVKFKAVKEAG